MVHWICPAPCAAMHPSVYAWLLRSSAISALQSRQPSSISEPFEQGWSRQAGFGETSYGGLTSILLPPKIFLMLCLLMCVCVCVCVGGGGGGVAATKCEGSEAISKPSSWVLK